MMITHISSRPTFKPGDMPPTGYLDWHEWADVQRKAGIKQVECGSCGLWKTPQELSGLIVEITMQSRRGPIIVKSAVCKMCAPLSAKDHGEA